MGSRSSLCLALALLAAPACRVHFDSIRTGGTWTAQDVAALTAGTDRRADVLRCMGPPDAVTYTLSEEVFLYRRGGHRGTDLRLLIPDPLINLLRPGLEVLSPEGEQMEEEEAFEEEAPAIAVTNTLIDRVFSFMNPLATEEAMALYGRRLRWDVARITLDRETHVTRTIELFIGAEAVDAKSLMKETLLLDPGQRPPDTAPERPAQP